MDRSAQIPLLTIRLESRWRCRTDYIEITQAKNVALVVVGKRDDGPVPQLLSGSGVQELWNLASTPVTAIP